MNSRLELKAIILTQYISKSGQLNGKAIKRDLFEIINNCIPNDLTLNEKCYWIVNDIYEPKRCIECNSINITYNNFTKGYANYCSTKCMANSRIIKDQKQKTCLEKYGVNTTIEMDSAKNNIHAYHQDENRQRLAEQKRKTTNLQKYGATNPNKNNDVIRNRINTNLEKYGVEHGFQNNEIKEKTKQTNLEKYGAEYITQTSTFKDNSKKTCLEKYGVTNISKCDENKKAKRLKNRTTFLNDFTNRIGNVVPLFDINDYADVKSLHEWRCVNCNTVFSDNLYAGSVPRCPTCYPKPQSKWELELQEYIKQYVDIETNTKQIIRPYELDIYIPNKSIAIECNGSYWHSENNGKDETYHLNKTNLCEEQNIQLLHIWEHEYNKNPELIKSIIAAKLDLNIKIDANKAVIQIIDDKTKELFLNNNHIQGSCSSENNIGLYYENELVALMAFDKSRFDDEYEWELTRYCSKQNINVIGGTSKLFKHFIKNYNPTNVISYVDRRYSKGNMYKQLGFSFKNNSNPNYKYTTDYKTMYNRVQFQKHKLSEELDIDDSKQKTINAGYDKLWDCGNSIWEWSKNKNE